MKKIIIMLVNLSLFLNFSLNAQDLDTNTSKSQVMCEISYFKNLDAIKVKTFIEIEKKSFFGLFSKKIVVEEFGSFFRNMPFKKLELKGYCSEQIVELKKEYLEGRILKSELIIEDKIYNIGNQDKFSYQFLKDTLGKNSILSIDQTFEKEFSLEFDNNTFIFKTKARENFDFDQNEIQKRFKKLTNYQKYLMIYNKDLSQIGVETTMEIEVETAKKIKIYGIFLNEKESELLVLKKIDQRSLKFNISEDKEFNYSKLIVSNQKINEFIKQLHDEVTRGIRKGFQGGKTKVSFISNKNNKNNEYVEFNNKLFLYTILDKYKQVLWEVEYEFNPQEFDIFLVKAE